MKVICIKSPICKSHPPMIFIGNTYTVVNERYFKDNEVVFGSRAFGGIHYELKEVEDAYFHFQLFASLSEIDETEFERSYNKQLV